jgi:WD40 repeat protein
LVGLTADLVTHRWDMASRKETSRRPLLDVPKFYKEAPYRFWRLTPDGAVAAGKAEWDHNDKKRQPWRFWDTVSGKECRPALTTSSLTRPWHAKYPWCFSPDGRILAMAGDLRWPEVWDTVTGKRQPWYRPDGHIGKGGLDHADAMAFHPSGTLLALGLWRTVALRDLTTGKQLWAREVLNTEKVTVLAFSPDGKTIGVGSQDTVRFLETATGLPVGFSKHDPGRFESPGGTVHFAAAGRVFQTQQKGRISVRDTANGKALHSIPGTEVVAASANGAIIAVRDDEQRGGELRVFDMKTAKELWQRKCYFVFDEIFASDGKTLPIVSNGEGTIKLLDAITGREIKKLEVSPPYFRLNYEPELIAAFSSDLKLAATNRNLTMLNHPAQIGS